MCAARGLPYAETLTGFKWIVRAGGGSAPLVLRLRGGARLLRRPGARPRQGRHHRRADRGRAGRRAEGAGPHAGRPAGRAGRRVRRAPHRPALRPGGRPARSPTRWPGSGRPPRPTLLGQPVDSVRDLLPEADVVILRTASARVVIRPSGTEPKLKAYLEVVEPVTDGDVPRPAPAPAAAIARAPRRDRQPPSASSARKGPLLTPGGIARGPVTRRQAGAGGRAAWSTARPRAATTRPTDGADHRVLQAHPPEKPAPLAISSSRRRASAAASPAQAERRLHPQHRDQGGQRGGPLVGEPPRRSAPRPAAAGCRPRRRRRSSGSGARG